MHCKLLSAALVPLACAHLAYSTNFSSSPVSSLSHCFPFFSLLRSTFDFLALPGGLLFFFPWYRGRWCEGDCGIGVGLGRALGSHM